TPKVDTPKIDTPKVDTPIIQQQTPINNPINNQEPETDVDKSGQIQAPSNLEVLTHLGQENRTRVIKPPSQNGGTRVIKP
ncbi:MAG: hypothetical protein WCO49_17960, partial [Nostocales cyanobacterium ELA608]